MAGSPKKRARRMALVIAAESGDKPARAPASVARADIQARAAALVDDPQEAKRMVITRLLIAIAGDWEPSPSQVMAGKVILEAIDQIAPKRPTSAREMLAAVQKALPELERRAALEAGEDVPAVEEPKGDW